MFAYLAKTKYHQITDILRLHVTSPNYRFVDELQMYKTHRTINFLGKCRAIKLIKIIADTKWIHYAYLRWFINVKPKNRKEVNHESYPSCRNLVGV